MREGLVHSRDERIFSHDDRLPSTTYRWIDVNDRLPKQDCRILGWAGIRVSEVYFNSRAKESEQWYSLAGHESPTHWLPLPEHPVRPSEMAANGKWTPSRPFVGVSEDGSLIIVDSLGHLLALADAECDAYCEQLMRALANRLGYEVRDPHED